MPGVGAEMPLCERCKRALWKVAGEVVHRFSGSAVCIPGDGVATAVPRPPATVENLPDSSEGRTWLKAEL